MIKSLSNLLIENKKFLMQLLFSLFLLYWFFYFFTPEVELSSEDVKSIEKLDTKIESLVNEQSDVEENVEKFSQEILVIQDSILRLKKQRTLIQNIYDEKDNIIRGFNDSSLDSFFTERYGYSQDDVISNTGGETNRK